MIVSGIEIEIIKKDIKNMHLSVLPPLGKVHISAPLNANDEAINLFAITKLGWIKNQIKNFENQSRQTEREYIAGESHYVWGRRYRLELNFSNKGNYVEIHRNKLILTVREKSTQSQREKFMNEWYRAELKAKFPEFVEKWEPIIGVQATAVGVKNMRTRWGTCNVKDKKVLLNLQLAKKPINCLEYVVVHELVHLLEKNHTTVFVEYMDKFLPNWRMVKDELNSFIMDRYLEE